MKLTPRSRVIAVILASLVLAACSGAAEPEPSPVPATEPPSPVASPTPEVEEADAEASVEAAWQAAMDLYDKSGDFSKVTEASLAKAEPSLAFVTPSKGPAEVSVLVMESYDGEADGAIALAALSSDGTCFGVMQQGADDTSYGDADEMTSCRASDVRRWLDVTSI